jgi:hypothetical protein
MYICAAVHCVMQVTMRSEEVPMLIVTHIGVLKVVVLKRADWLELTLQLFLLK